MAKPPPKLSGLVKMGAVVASTPVHELPDFPVQGLAETHASVIGTQPTVALEPVRNLQTIGIHLIDPNPLAPREIYTSEMILNRAEDLRAQGQHDPIHVIPNPDATGRFIICDGWTRVQACKQHKVFDALLAEVHTELSLQEAAWFGYQQNECRSQHCDLDRAMFYEKLIAEGETSAEIARRAKLSKSMMSFYRAFAKLPSEVIEVVRREPVKFSCRVVYPLAKLHEKLGMRKTLSLATKFADEDQPVRWLENQVQSYLHPTKHATAAPQKHIRYSNGYYKQRGDGFEVSITVTADKREEFAEALEELLNTVVEAQATADAQNEEK